MPFRFQDEIATADVAFEAWGETQEELFISCAAALLRTMAETPEQVARHKSSPLFWSTKNWICCYSRFCRN